MAFDPFATALGVLQGAAGAVTVVWTPAGGAPSAPFGAIRSQRSAEMTLPIGAGAVLDGDTVMLALSSCPSPARGDTVTFLATGETLAIIADPLLDVEGLSWMAQLG